MRYLGVASVLAGFVASSLLASTLTAQAVPAGDIGVAAAIKGQVTRTASVQTDAPVGQISSGQMVYLGDAIKVGNQGRLQVILRDETVFTLGANTSMTIDEFVYNPDTPEQNRLTTSVQRGVFRFVSGKVAASNKQAMHVKMPKATIGIRGTAAAGEVAPDGAATVILLGPSNDNALGLDSGAISVTNDAGEVDITRPGFATEIAASGLQNAPSDPSRATNEQIARVEFSLLEQAAVEIANELGISVEALNLQEGKDTDGDGVLDKFAANERISTAIGAATENSGATQDRALLAATALSLFGAELLELDDSERASFFEGVNLGGAVADIFEHGAEYLGQTSFDDIRNAGLTGSTTFVANNVIMTGDCGGASQCGSYSTTQRWNFTDQTVTSTLTGQFSIDVGENNPIAVSLNQQGAQQSFADAIGGAYVSYSDVYGTPNDLTSTVFVGDPPFGTEPTQLQNGFTTLENGASFATQYRLEINSDHSLSNVQFGGNGPRTGNFAQQSVSGRVIQFNEQDQLAAEANGENYEPPEVSKVEGLVFGMDTEQ